MTNDRSLDDSLRKAAVLVSCLEQTDARVVLARLGPTPADRIRTAIGRLGHVPLAEREGVIREFLQQRERPVDQAQSVELDADLARRLAAAAAAEQVEPPPPTLVREEPDQAPFAFLLETDADVVAPFLARESPQTVAVVLSFLQRRQAAEILRRLEPAFQRQVLTRLASLEDIDPACIGVVAAELRTWIDKQRSARRPGGDEKLMAGAIANRGDGDDRAELIAELHREARRGDQEPPVLAPAATPPVDSRRSRVDFEDLIRLSDGDLLRVLAAAPQEVLALALAGADDALIQRITGSLPRREAKRIKRSIRLQGPTRLHDIDAAKQRIAAMAAEILK